jgi:hypothetical protein
VSLWLRFSRGAFGLFDAPASDTHTHLSTVVVEVVALTARASQPPKELALGWRTCPLLPHANVCVCVCVCVCVYICVCVCVCV